MIFAFGDCELDTERYEFRRGGEVLAVEPRVFDLLRFLAENAGRLVTKDEILERVWQGRAVSDSALSSQIKALRKAIGDDGRTQAIVRTVHGKGFRFEGEVAARDGTGPAAGTAATPGQRISFCRAADGTRIAYSLAGDGPPLVKTANWLNHLEYDWESLIWRHLMAFLSRDRTLVRYDERGNGLSERDLGDTSLDAYVSDLEAVVAAAGLDRFPLLGISQGCAIAIAYASRHPEKVSHLILHGGYASGWRVRSTAEEIAARNATLTLVRIGWGRENDAFRQLFTSQFFPGATLEQMQAFNELQRRTTSPENAYRLLESFSTIDVRGLLPSLRVPTLVTHCRGDARVAFDQGLELAAEIPGAQFMPLESTNHLVLEHEPAWVKFTDAVTRFLSPEGVA